MGLFGKKNENGGILNVIRCDEEDYLVWKWRPEGRSENDVRPNAIRWGSRLRVKEGSVAVFVYKQKDGTVQDFIEGPVDTTLKTNNLPVISGIIGLVYGGNTPFQAEVYFINLAKLVQFKFAVPYFDIYDPRFSDFGIPTAVRGSINFKITDYKEFIKLHRMESFSLHEFQIQVRDAVVRYVKGVVANAPAEHNIPAVQIERKVSDINELAEAAVKKRLFDDFGVTVSGMDIAVIEIDKSSVGYRQLMAVTKDLESQRIKAQTEVEIKEMYDSQRLGVLEREKRIEADVEEDKYARHKQTQSANYAAYQTEAQEHVGVAGAEGLGKMGANGGGTVSGGFNPASIMAGMAVGGAIGQNLAGTMGTMMGGLNQAAPGTAGVATPPPIPQPLYHVALNGQAAGPFNLSILSQMVSNGQLTRETLVWHAGMANWQKAGETAELKTLFQQTPPPIPGGAGGVPPVPGMN